jgi:hypothetical protein
MKTNEEKGKRSLKRKSEKQIANQSIERSNQR